MSLLQSILEAQGGAAVSQLARQFGLDEQRASDALKQLVPALAGGVKRNINQPGGLDALATALNRGNHSRYMDNLDQLTQDTAVQDGNGILGHLLGSKDVSRQLAARAQSNTGIDASLLKKMLPVIATMVMGSLAKNTGSAGGGSGGGLLGQLSQMAGGSAGGGGGLQSMLTSMLDKDGDGSVVDDLLGSLLKR
ncbi:MAG: DUF937 domain-containing protein [Gammaproteobacteria bacterium]|nr:DUF937 domain-containing protein [Gammaproteobacteria bacterium]